MWESRTPPDLICENGHLFKVAIFVLTYISKELQWQIRIETDLAVDQNAVLAVVRVVSADQIRVVVLVRLAAANVERYLGRDVNVQFVSTSEWDKAETDFVKTVKAKPLVELDLS